MADDTTPADLERELGVDQRRIRHYLRQRYGHLPAYTDNWHLNGRAADDVRRHFRSEAAIAPAPPADTGSIPALFQEATGTTTFGPDGTLRYLPSEEEERQQRLRNRED